jgi:hypothetical protein
MLTPKERRAISYHEGAHAAVTYALGDVPTSCEFTDRGGRTTRLGINKSSQDQICMDLAGMAMDRRLGSEIPHGYHNDYARVWQKAFDAYPNRADAINVVNAAEKRIHRLVQHVAPGAMLLGAELYKHGALDRQQIDAILSKTVKRLKSPHTPLAMDRRRIDHDGRMHVDVSNLSKAAINPYCGEEIPYWEQLGLDPKKVYMLLRHPDELKRAVDTFNGLPVLDAHVPMTADDHLQYLVIGSTGTNAKFEAPYLKNGLSLWTREAVDAVKGGGKKQLSCAYSYLPVMQPGVYEGRHYDGVMTNLRGNHVALVMEGRAGADCVVGDSANRKLVRRFAMGRAFDQLPKSLQPDAQSKKDEEPNMKPWHRNMQQIEDPNKVSARTNQPRGPTQQETFGKQAQGMPADAELPDQMKNRGQAFGIPGPSGADPGTQTPSSRLATAANNNGSGKFASLIELLDALEAARENGQEVDDEEELGGGELPGPIQGEGGPESIGTIHDADPLIQPPDPGMPRREAPPQQVKMPGQDHSCSVGDARILQERLRAPEQRLDRHLRNSGMRSAAHRDYARELGRRQIAHDVAMAEAGGDLADFLAFCPGAGRIEALTPSARPSTPNNTRKIAQDGSVVWVWQFNPMTNALEQVPVSRKR